MIAELNFPVLNLVHGSQFKHIFQAVRDAISVEIINTISKSACRRGDEETCRLRS